MSINLTPTVDRHERPPRPSRSKRSSGIMARDEVLTPLVSTSSSHLEWCEDSMNMGSTTREEISTALQAKCMQEEQLEARVQELEEQEKRCIAEKAELHRVLKEVQDRSEEVFKEQAQLEQDVEARDDLIERLKSSLSMAERELKDCQKASLIQERAFETERTTFQAQETHLNSRIRQLQLQSTSSRLQLPASSPSEDLQEDLDSLRVSHSNLLVQLDRLSSEVQDLRIEHARLKEENEGWEYLVREQTFTSHLFQRDNSKSEVDVEDGGNRSQLNVLDEELESEMDHLHSDLEAQSPTVEDGPLFPRSVPGSRQPSSRYPSTRKTSSSTAFSEGSHLPIPGSDLAAELGRAGALASDPPELESSKATEEENKRLREEVKALQLYCSKILDRIIAQDGFEHVLNVDYKTRRMGRSTSGRGNLSDVVKMMQGEPLPEIAPAPAPPSRAARPVSTLVRGTSEMIASPEPVAPVDDKSSKRAKRGFSLDLRSFGFGSPTSEAKNPLKQLTLSPSPAPQTHSRLPGRKLEPQAEDEEDRRERSRLEAALKLMGIDKSQSHSKAPTLHDTDAMKRSSTVKTTTASTPLSRLSSVLGFSDAQLPADPDPSPERVDAALKEYDAREKERRASLSSGKQEGGYTSPPRTTRRLTDLGGGGGRDQKMRPSGSITTLWSVGSSPGQD